MFYLGNTEKTDKFVPVLKDCNLERSFNLKNVIYSINVLQSYRNILVVGCKSGQIKYIDLNKNKMVSINTDNDDFVGDLLCLEKLRIPEKE